MFLRPRRIDPKKNNRSTIRKAVTRIHAIILLLNRCESPARLARRISTPPSCTTIGENSSLEDGRGLPHRILSQFGAPKVKEILGASL
jgi:hypothetical protein